MVEHFGWKRISECQNHFSHEHPSRILHQFHLCCLFDRMLRLCVCCLVTNHDFVENFSSKVVCFGSEIWVWNSIYNKLHLGLQKFISLVELQKLSFVHLHGLHEKFPKLTPWPLDLCLMLLRPNYIIISCDSVLSWLQFEPLFGLLLFWDPWSS